MPQVPILSDVGNHGNAARPSPIQLDENSKIQVADQLAAVMYAARIFDDYRRNAGQDRLAVLEAEQYKQRVLAYNDNLNAVQGQDQQEPPWATALKNEISDRIDRVARETKEQLERVSEDTKKVHRETKEQLERISEDTKKVYSIVHEINLRDIQARNALADGSKLYQVPLKNGTMPWGTRATFERKYPDGRSSAKAVDLPPLASVRAVNSLGENQVRGYLHGYFGEPVNEDEEGHWKESMTILEMRTLVLVAIGAAKLLPRPEHRAE
ncbi:hypothetical protein AAF712_006693 [Marasmius tenuissimus]|uniref:Mug135-like C-terminal domain-containing protein n=1 Tax=Marasmius tenuissimus TaxID=585030 RepID=A0ABR2ZYZ2_9AGAR|nr:hypothetical protein PM082_018976 [Marasmius tenuissimus]